MIGICTLIYWPGLNSTFLLDDHTNIKNAVIDDLSINNLKQAIFKNRSGVHPITRAIPTLSIAINSPHDGINSHQLKYQNLMLHLICGLLVFLFIYLLAKAFTDNYRKILSVALLSSTAWLIHPLHVSTTLYTIQRITQFSTLFTLLALCFFLYAKQSSKYKNKLTLYFVAFPIALSLSLMSKENSALICFYLISISYMTRESIFLKNTQIDKFFYYVFGWGMLIAGTIVLLLKFPHFLNYSNRDFTLLERLYSQSHIVLAYLKNLLIPQLSSMGLFLDDTSIQRTLDISTSIKSVVIIGLFTFSCLWVYKKKFLGILSIFFFGHLLESSIFPLELAFEHRNYFPSIGVIACLSWLVFSLKRKILPSFLAVIFILTFTIILNLRVGFWSNEHEWQKTNLSFHPKSLRTHINYIVYLETHFGIKAAKNHVQKAQKQLPNSAELFIIELGHVCLENSPVSGITESSKLLKKLTDLLNKKRISTQEENALYLFSGIIENHRCKNIDTQGVFNLIDLIIQNNEVNKSNISNLYAARALILIAGNYRRKAHKDLILAFKKSGQVEHLIPAAKILIENENTKQAGISFIKKINNGDFFDTSKHQTTLTRINKFLNEYVNK